MKKVEFFKKTQETCETYKNVMERIVDITNPTQSQKSKHIPPPHSTYKKNQKFKTFSKTQKWCETFKNLVKSVEIVKNEGKSTSIHFFRTRKISKNEQKTKTCFNLEF